MSMLDNYYNALKKDIRRFDYITTCMTFCCMVSALQRRPEDINLKAADMWSFAVLLWELETREVPHAELSPMETGMKVSNRRKRRHLNH